MTAVVDPFALAKHADHDQSSHGNWARGGKYRNTSYKDGNPFYAPAVTGLQNFDAARMYDTLNSSRFEGTPEELVAEFATFFSGRGEFDLAAEVWLAHQNARIADDKAYRELVDTAVHDPEHLARYGESRDAEVRSSMIEALDEGSPRHDGDFGSDMWEELSTRYGTTDSATMVDRWMADNQRILERTIPTAEVHIRMKAENLDALLDDGEFKTVHQDGALDAVSEWGDGDGGNGAAARRRLEERVFGSFPVYGHLAANNDGVDNHFRHNIMSQQANLGYYGDVSVRLKDDVRDRTTYTVGDSFSRQQYTTPAPMTAPHWRSAVGVDLNGVKNVDDFDVEYVEAQIHGRVTLNDIDAVVFKYEPDVSTRYKLASNNIPYRVVAGTRPDIDGSVTIKVPSPLIKTLDPFELTKHADHDQSSHGNWARASDGGYKPRWSPTMSRRDAELWARDSKIRTPLTHTSTAARWTDVGTGILADGFRPGDTGVFGPGIYLGSEELEIKGEGVPPKLSQRMRSFMENKAFDFISSDTDAGEIIDRQAAEYAYGAHRSQAPTRRVMVDVQNPLRVNLGEKDATYAGRESVLGALYPDGIELPGGRWTPEMTFYEWADMGGEDGRGLDQLVQDAGYDSVIIEHEGPFEWQVGGDQVIVYDPKHVTVIEDDEYRYRKHADHDQSSHGNWARGGGKIRAPRPGPYATLNEQIAWAESDANPYRTGRILGGDTTSGDFRVEHVPERRFTELWQRTYNGYDMVRERALDVLEGIETPEWRRDELFETVEGVWFHNTTDGYQPPEGAYTRDDLNQDMDSAGAWVADGLLNGETGKVLFRGQNLSTSQYDRILKSKGIEISLSPSSTSSELDAAQSYALGDDFNGQPTVFRFPETTKHFDLSPHSDWSDTHPEQIVAGTFRVADVFVPAGEGFTYVNLEPVEQP